MTVHVHGYGQGNSVKSGGVKLVLCANPKRLKYEFVHSNKAQDLRKPLIHLVKARQRMREKKQV